MKTYKAVRTKVGVILTVTDDATKAEVRLTSSSYFRFDFGNSGAGAHELAAAILTNATPKDRIGAAAVSENAPAFVAAFIAPAQGLELVVTYREILAWLAAGTPNERVEAGR